MHTPSLWWYRAATKHFLPAAKGCMPAYYSQWGIPLLLDRNDYEVSRTILAGTEKLKSSSCSQQSGFLFAGRGVHSFNFHQELCSVDQLWLCQGNHSIIHKFSGMTACQHKLKVQVLFIDCYTAPAETAHRLPLPQFQHKPPFYTSLLQWFNPNRQLSLSQSFLLLPSNMERRTEGQKWQNSWTEIRTGGVRWWGKNPGNSMENKWCKSSHSPLADWCPASTWKVTRLEHSPQVTNSNHHHRLLWRKLTPFQPHIPLQI